MEDAFILPARHGHFLTIGTQDIMFYALHCSLLVKKWQCISLCRSLVLSVCPTAFSNFANICLGDRWYTRHICTYKNVSVLGSYLCLELALDWMGILKTKEIEYVLKELDGSPNRFLQSPLTILGSYFLSGIPLKCGEDFMSNQYDSWFNLAEFRKAESEHLIKKLILGTNNQM